MFRRTKFSNWIGYFIAFVLLVYLVQISDISQYTWEKEKISPESFLNSIRDGKRLWYDGPFETVPNYPYKLFQSEEACEVAEKYQNILILGDSFVRHITQALFILLTGDPIHGGVRPWMLNDEQKAFCRFEKQFDDRTNCRPAAHCSRSELTQEFIDQHFCLGRSVNVTFLWYYNRYHLKDHMNDLKKVFQYHLQSQDKRPLAFLVHSSIHDQYQEKVVEEFWLRPLNEIVQEYAIQKPIVPIFHQPHYIPSNKPEHYAKAGQGLEDGLRFINYTRYLLRDLKWFEFSTWNLTTNMTSYDGTHFGYSVNYLKATLFLKFLDLWSNNQ